MKRYVYHYYASCQLPGSCEITVVDGIAGMKNKIADYDSFKRFKQMISEQNDLPADRIIIKTLTPLN